MWSRLTYGCKGDKPYNYSVFICDTSSDLEELPTNERKSLTHKVGKCSVGSRAIVVDEQTTYILNNNNEWKIFSSAGSGGSGDSSDYPDGNGMRY